MIRSVQREYSHTMGLSAHSTACMGPIRRSAMRSGWVMPRRLGSRSANTTNSEVTPSTDTANASWPACGSASQRPSTAASGGPNSPSPTMPPKMATAFTPICTVVK